MKKKTTESIYTGRKKISVLFDGAGLKGHHTLHK